MTRLEKKIRERIRTAGPISVADYMALCLYDPEDGYYTTRNPFGVGGDFTTAPEISQMFGELVAVWLYAAWQACGTPSNSILAEIGPGRGTLMKDILRTLNKLDPRLDEKFRFALIETSPRLTEIQKQTLAASPGKPKWYRELRELPERPLFIVGNELFDAIPVNQYVKTPSGWRERVVGLTKEDELAFLAGTDAPDPALLPPGWNTAPPGAIAEISPAREAVMETICHRLAKQGGAGLFIDYGHDVPALGDTLQAMRQHAYADVLADAGEADLTAHVDFSSLANVARRFGLTAHLTSQGEFLLKLGLLERAGRLGAGKTGEMQEQIRQEVNRLAAPDQMGSLFKVLAVLPKDVNVPPFG